jgi:hypothetical protein
MNQEAALLRKLEHGRVVGENLGGDLTGLALALVADDLVHQHLAWASALEIGAHKNGEFRPAIVGVGDGAGNAEGSVANSARGA